MFYSFLKHRFQVMLVQLDRLKEKRRNSGSINFYFLSFSGHCFGFRQEALGIRKYEALETSYYYL